MGGLHCSSTTKKVLVVALELVDVRAVLGGYLDLVARLNEQRDLDHRAVLERRVLDAQRRVGDALGGRFLSNRKTFGQTMSTRKGQHSLDRLP